ncbi:MAG: hypothetical protein GY737_13975 [Desulfobacteraceae bacterium]|nr:hypothetical protein [Desulfobacteraceae bacterium]
MEKGLDETSKVLGAYLLSCEHGNSLGCFRCSQAYAADDLGYPIDTVSIGYEKLAKNDFLIFCEKSRFVLIPKYLRWNPFQNKNHAKGTLKLINEIPSSFTLAANLIESMEKYSGKFLDKKQISEAKETLSHTVSKPYPIDYRDKDKDKDKENIKKTNKKKSDLSDRTRAPDDEFDFYASFEYRIISKIIASIQELDMNCKVPEGEEALKKWAVHVDRLNRLDKRTEEQIEFVVDWVVKDPFWKKNIRSAEKLREKFDQLVANIQSERKLRGGTGQGRVEQNKQACNDFVSEMLSEADHGSEQS